MLALVSRSHCWAAPGFACPVTSRAPQAGRDYNLARSLVDAELPEDDLLAGIRECVTL